MGGVQGYTRLIAKIVHVDNKTPCNTEEMSQYTKYIDEFLAWAEDKKSSFNKLENNIRNGYKFSTIDNDAHYIAKYICREHFNVLTDYEKYSIEIGRATKETLKDYYNYNNTNHLIKYAKPHGVIRKTIELNKNNTKQGDNNER